MTEKGKSMWLRFFRSAGISTGFDTKYAVVFDKNRIKMDMLMDLNKECLRDMGIIAMGDIIAILKHARIAHKAKEPDAEKPSPPPSIPDSNKTHYNIQVDSTLSTVSRNTGIIQRKTTSVNSSRGSLTAYLDEMPATNLPPLFESSPTRNTTVTKKIIVLKKRGTDDSEGELLREEVPLQKKGRLLPEHNISPTQKLLQNRLGPTPSSSAKKKANVFATSGGQKISSSSKSSTQSHSDFAQGSESSLRVTDNASIFDRLSGRQGSSSRVTCYSSTVPRTNDDFMQTKFQVRRQTVPSPKSPNPDTAGILTAEIKLYCGFQEVTTGNYFRKSLVDKGKALLKASHVKNVHEIKCPDKILIKSTCVPQTNISAKEYIIQIQLNLDRTIFTGACTCKAGIVARCKHGAATIMYINEHKGTSQTSLKQSWGIPIPKSDTKAHYSKGISIQALYNLTPKMHLRPPYPAKLIYQNFQDIDCPLNFTVQKEMETSPVTEVRQLLKNLITQVHEKCEQEILTETLQNIIKSSNYVYDFKSASSTTPNKKNVDPLLSMTDKQSQYYNSNIILSANSIVQLAIKSMGQNQFIWKEARRIRISGTRAHAIKTRKSNFQKLAETLVAKKDFANKNTEYGLRMEKVARIQLQNKSSCRILETGVIVCRQQPWLCVSPDGIIINTLNNRLLEIKCPSSRKNKVIVDWHQKLSYVKYLKFENDTLKLNMRHGYFTQIQVGMYVTNTYSCDFIVHSSKETVCICISMDELFLQNLIPKLEHFYFTYMLNVLIN